MVNGDENYLVLPYTTSEVIAVSHNGSVVNCHESSDFFKPPPSHSEGATGGLLNLGPSSPDDNMTSYYQTTPVVCGGSAFNSLTAEYPSSRECYRLGGFNYWIEPHIGRLNKERSRAASVAIKNGSTLWVTGGGDKKHNPLDSTEFLDVIGSSLVSRWGPGLPRKMLDHCLEMISDKVAISYGGKIWGEPFANSWSFDLDPLSNSNEEWMERATMTTARAGHGCGVIRDALSPDERKIVVAAGGCNRDMASNMVVLDSVELLHTNGPVLAFKWITGPNMPQPLCDASSATIVDGTRMFVAGGISEFNTAAYHVTSKSIYYIQCRLSLCDWTTIGLELNDQRINAVAMIVPLNHKRDFDIETTLLPFKCEGGES